MKKIILGIALIFSSATIFAEGAGYIKFVSQSGKVSLVSTEQSQKHDFTKRNISVEYDQIIRTDKKAHVKLYMFDGAYEIDIYPGTLYKINRPTKKKNSANLFLGKILFAINKTVKEVFGQDYEVKTKFSTMGVKGTSGFVIESQVGTRFLVKEGAVEVSNRLLDSEPVEVPAGTKTIVSGGKPPTPPEPFTDKEVQDAEVQGSGSAPGSEQSSSPNQQSDAQAAEEEAAAEEQAIVTEEAAQQLEEISETIEKIEQATDVEKETEFSEILIQIDL